MASKTKGPDSNGVNRLVADVLARRKEAEKGYRERALKLFPPICGHCGREFSGKRLRELTVHHKDHNHDNNPPDGSNWELLCIYCHDNEHSRFLDHEWHDEDTPDSKPKQNSIHKPFADLNSLMKGKK